MCQLISFGAVDKYNDLNVFWAGEIGGLLNRYRIILYHLAKVKTMKFFIQKYYVIRFIRYLLNKLYLNIM